MVFEDKKDCPTPRRKEAILANRSCRSIGDLGAITKSANNGHPNADGGTSGLIKT